MKSSISIIIPSLGDAKKIKKLVGSINQQINKLEFVEVVIVLNGFISEENQRLIQNLKTDYNYLNIVIKYISNLGANTARNNGLKISQGQIVFFFDDDCELVDRDFLQKHLDFHKFNSEVFAFGGSYILPEKSNYWDKIYNKIQNSWLNSGKLEGSRHRYLLGGNFSIKKNMLQETNIKFDENLIYGGTELDFFYHCNQQNLILIKNELAVLHNTNESFKSICYKIYKQGRGAAYLKNKFSDRNRMGTQQKRMKPLFFNYVFWLGYYSYYRKNFYIIYLILEDFLKGFHKFRGQLLDLVKHKIELKKRNGDRF